MHSWKPGQELPVLRKTASYVLSSNGSSISGA